MRNVYVLYVDYRVNRNTREFYNIITEKWKTLEEEFGPLFVLPKAICTMECLNDSNKTIKDIKEIEDKKIQDFIREI